MYGVKSQPYKLLNGAVSITLFLACSFSMTDAAGLPANLHTGQTETESASMQRLAQGQTVERELKGGETHTHIVSLRRGEFLRVLVEQHGINVVLTLRSRVGLKLVEVNLLPEAGTESVSYEATEAGDYLLEVRASAAIAPVGRYRLTSSVKPRATTEDITRLAAERLLSDVNELLRVGGATELRRATAKSQQALALWRRLGDTHWVAFALNARGTVSEKLGAWKQALGFYNEALRLQRSSNDKLGESFTLTNIGFLYDSTDRRQEAIEYLKQALAIQRAARNRFGEAFSLSSIGNIYVGMAEHRKALDAYNEAHSIYKSLGDSLGEANTLFNLARSHAALNEREAALNHYRQALSIFHAAGERDGEADTLINIGDIYRESGEQRSALDNQNALDNFNRALALRRSDGDRPGAADALWRIGDITYALGERRKALDFYNEALELCRDDSNRRAQADLHSRIGSVHYYLDEWQQSVNHYERALKLYQSIGDKKEEATTLQTLAGFFFKRDQRKAIGYYQQLLQLQHAAKDTPAEAATLRNIGFLYEDIREWQRALDSLNKSLALYKAVGDRSGEADSFVNIGNVYYHQNKLPEALAYYEKGLALYQSVKHLGGHASALLNIGLVHDVSGDSQKAINYYGRALPLTRQSLDKKTEADTLANMGLIYADLGEQQKALDHYRQALKIRQQLGDKSDEADTLINIGVSYRAIKNDKNALASFEQALEIRRAGGDKPGEANALIKIGETYASLGEQSKALEYFQRALPLYRDIGDRDSETDMLVRIGFLKLVLNEPRQALTYVRQAQSFIRADRDKKLEAALLILSGAAHLLLRERQTALAQFQQSLRFFKAERLELGQAWALILLGAAYEEFDETDKALSYFNQALPYVKSLGNPKTEADVLKNIGELYASLGKNAEALETYSRALTLYRSSENPSDEASVLIAIGKVYDKQGEKEKAAGYYAKALLLRLETTTNPGSPEPLEIKGGTYDSQGERKEEQDHLNFYFKSYQMAKASGLVGPEAEMLSRVMGTLMQRTPELAIIFGKQAIEKYQEIRANPGRHNMVEAKNTYLRSFQPTCRDLADLLIEKGRLYEAQQVLALLKEDEYLRYVRRDASEIAALSQRADLRPEERKLFAEYTRIFDKLAAVSSRHAELSAKKKDLPEGAQLSDAEVSELEQLNRDLAVANEAFKLFIERIKTEFEKSKRDVAYELEQNRALQTQLREWGEGTVSLYTVVGPERYRIILTTPERQVDGKFEITAADLNKKVMAFRQTLMNPAIDPRPQARELYDILLKPIEQQLENAKAKTLIWELDGTLRYLPLAALHDGKQYMAERYQQAIITLASRTRLSEQVKNEWRVLGLGVSAKWGSLPALPAVVGELEYIVRDERKSVTPKAAQGSVMGLLPGISLLDKDFTARAFAGALGRNYSLVHIASHFNFSPVDAEKSFLLLGDGSQLTLKDIDSGGEYTFAGVELLTLSACDTGIGEGGESAERDGKEIESFGVIAQNRGAKAVMATLWGVFDDSTRELMRQFYKLRSTTPNISKSEALRRAQLALLRGELSPVESAGAQGQRSELVGHDSRRPTDSTFPYDPKKPYAHPYYWAPFILIGNWR